MRLRRCFPFGFLSLSIAISLAFASQIPEIDAERIGQHLEELGRIGSDGVGGVSRLAFSQADVDARRYVSELMKGAGLEVRVDAAGNLIGRIPGREESRGIILVGSHLDSVPNAGRFDGPVGVISAIECARVLRLGGAASCSAIEVIVFADEEGSMIGSRALSGSIPLETLSIVNSSGISVRDGLSAIGGDPDRIDEVLRQPGDIKAFLELHIEQGGRLDSRRTEIGIVEGIVGVHWWDVVVQGFANHAGTTPMAQRQDALLAASEMIIEINRIVRVEPGGQVGTVGRIRAEPGAPNVVPGRVLMSLELRDLQDSKIRMLLDQIKAAADRVARTSNTEISIRPVEATAMPVLTDGRVRAIIKRSADALGFSTLLMPSGAGHDAQNIARVAPVGMIFIPSVGGVSHSPREFTRIDDIRKGAVLLLKTIIEIDGSALQ